MLPVLADHYRVLTWDVRRHGRSRPGPFSLEQALSHLIAILDRLEADQAYFVGHSMGGNLHQELVFYFPQRVKGMVFVGCTWNFQKLTPIDTFLLKSAKLIFKLYPYQTLTNQSLAETAMTRESQEYLRPAMDG